MTKNERLSWLLETSKAIFAPGNMSMNNRGVSGKRIAYAIMTRVNVPTFYSREAYRDTKSPAFPIWSASSKVQARVQDDLRTLAKADRISSDDRGSYTFYTERETANIALYGSPTHPVDRAACARETAAGLIARAQALLVRTRDDLARVEVKDDLFLNSVNVTNLVNSDLNKIEGMAS